MPQPKTPTIRDLLLTDVRGKLAEAIDADAAAVTAARSQHGASRFAGAGAHPDVVAQLAAGGSIAHKGVHGEPDGGVTRTGEGRVSERQGRALRLAVGMKALAEGTPSASVSWWIPSLLAR